MSTKTCPSCGEEVPAAANRCKECFHDFTEDAPAKTSGPIILLATLAAMAVVAALTFFVVSQRPLDQRILVDEETESVVWTTTYRTGPVTERLRWDEIVKIEHVTTSGGAHEIIALTNTGDRKVIERSEGNPLRANAEHYAQVMEKPLDLIDNTRGFHKMSDPNDPKYKDPQAP